MKQPGVLYSHPCLKFVCTQFFQMEAYLEVKGRDLGESFFNELVSGIWRLLGLFRLLATWSSASCVRP